MRRLLLLPIVFAALFFAAGCDRPAAPAEILPETDEPLYKQAQRLHAESNPRGAQDKYLQLIDRRPDAAESHMEVGLIYLAQKQPLDAIYHFRQYSRLRDGEGSVRVDQVSKLIITAQKMYLEGIPGKPFENDTIRIESLEKQTLLQNENTQLKQQIAGLQEKIRALEARTPVVVQQPVAPAESISSLALIPAQPPLPGPPQDAAVSTIPATYTVKDRDTLSSISLSVYGTRNRWREILAANRDQLPNERALRAGMVLKIPR